MFISNEQQTKQMEMIYQLLLMQGTLIGNDSNFFNFMEGSEHKILENIIIKTTNKQIAVCTQNPYIFSKGKKRTGYKYGT